MIFYRNRDWNLEWCKLQLISYQTLISISLVAKSHPEGNSLQKLKSLTCLTISSVISFYTTMVLEVIFITKWCFIPYLISLDYKVAKGSESQSSRGQKKYWGH